MNCQDDGRPVLHGDDIESDAVIRSLTEQFRIIQGDPGRVAELCRELGQDLADPPDPADVERLLPLLPLLAARSGPLALPLFDLLEKAASSCPDPWPLILGMTAARDGSLVRRALELALRRIGEGSLGVDRGVVRALAGLIDAPGKCLDGPDCLPLAGEIVRRMELPAREPAIDPLRQLFLEETDGRIRSLGARLLDIQGEPVSMELARQALGDDAFAFLEPYLLFTRATHSDVASLLPSPDVPPPALPSLRRAHAAMGKNLLRRVIAGTGWRALNLGIQVRHYVRLTPGDSLPLMLSPPEAALAARCGKFRKRSEVFIVIMEGGGPEEQRDARPGEEDPASRFRSYNLLHAEILADFLAVAPLNAERARSILARMDTIVGEFSGLFSSVSDECSLLTGIYEGIRSKILAELKVAESEGRLSPELARLTVMFEDPRSPGDIRTLHGLKRYLHQKGLQLGFRLVQRTRSTNRTVNLLLTSRSRILQSVEEIRYSDFEPGNAGPSPVRMPYAVGVVADGFARQLLYGQESFPRVDIFCYGNEVHYFLAFRNHPAFLRINYAPPLQGGMIDLEYYGVSKYDLTGHPDFSLDALQRFFRSLGFFILVENTHVHARYDKEHTADLKSLCEKAEAVFCLAPYLLDIDWTIGGLDLDAGARRLVASAWADAFAAWGVLPLRFLLTKDRRGVIESVSTAPPGRREVVWSGRGAYPFRFRAEAGEFVDALFALAERLVPEIGQVRLEGGRGRTGQLHLERALLAPLRDASARGELAETPDGYEPAAPGVFRRVTAPEMFAALIASGDAHLESAATLAYLVGPLERFLSFRAAGSVGSCEIQSARLTLQGGELGIHLLRGEPSLAFYTHGTVLFQRRDTPDGPWESNAVFDTSAFLALLRRANYPAPGPAQAPPWTGNEVHGIREKIAMALPPEPRRPVPGERTIAALRASPGGAVGRVLFGGRGRAPADFDGAILVTPALQPGDGVFLQRASAVVSTGGGILSHAALLAAQFHKPAVIVDGRWESDADGGPALHYSTVEFELEGTHSYGCHIWSRKDLRVCEHVLREGDLVALDANEDVLRVLGQDRDALELHEEFRRFTAATLELAAAAGDRDILLYRGRRIRARHEIGKVLSRLSDPILACHAVHELLLDSAGIGRSASPAEKSQLIGMVLNNSRVAEAATAHLRWIVRELRQRSGMACRNAVKRIPESGSLYEILSLRLDALHAFQSLDGVRPCLEACGFEAVSTDVSAIGGIEASARSRVGQLRETIAAALRSADLTTPDAHRRHLLRQWERLARLVGPPDAERAALAALQARLADADETSRASLARRTIIRPGDGGFELSGSIGWKAANLAETGRIAGRSLAPPWFAVTDLVFREILESPIGTVSGGGRAPGGASTLREAIESILTRGQPDPPRDSAMIRELWDSVVLPEKLAGEIVDAYRRIGEGLSATPAGPAAEPLVALRSSSHQEDAELDARAGEFDTFLFIRGEKQLLRYLLRTWSGLWSERALHTRAMLGMPSSFAGGGVIVQRMVNSRVSGVLQTINVARNEFRELVINAGWGLGEGIVSGTVAADQVVVSKETDPAKGPLRFSYITADKRESVEFNKRAGFGTIRCEAPYHKRLRPALEYTELCELVETALRLESSYGYPLDIEFGIEGCALWILQVRPVPSSFTSMLETLEHHPLTRAGSVPPPARGEQPP